MSTETSPASDSGQPLSPSDGSEPLLVSGSKMPPLPPGYHFIISLCDVGCTREQVDAIHADLVEVARTLIREYDLRTASGRFANTRVHINRTVPLLDEDLSEQDQEVRTENLQGAQEPGAESDQKLLLAAGASSAPAADQ
jgi:hypothetical protein